MSKKTYYISGPMSGYPEHNFPAFHAMEAKMKRVFGAVEWYTIVNPATLEVESGTDLPWEHYLKRDLVAMMDCNILVLLEGWEKSGGAQLEVFNAYVLGMEFLNEELWPISKEDIKTALDYDLLENGGKVSAQKVHDELEYKNSEELDEDEDIWSKNSREFQEKIDPNYKPNSSMFDEFRGDCKRIQEETDREVCSILLNAVKDNLQTNILQEADKLTNGDRQDAYGHPAVNFQNTANLWNDWINGKYPDTELELSNEDVGMMMLLVKVAREMNAPKKDNLIDGIGYLNTVQMIRDYEG